MQAGFRKNRGTRNHIANIFCIIEKAREFPKTSDLLTVLKPLTVWITRNCESCSVVSDSLQPHGHCSLWNSPGQNTEVGRLSIL